MWIGGTSADSTRVSGHARPIRAVPKADIYCIRGVEIGNVLSQIRNELDLARGDGQIERRLQYSRPLERKMLALRIQPIVSYPIRSSENP